MSICLIFHQLLSHLTSIYSMWKCQSDLSSATCCLISHQFNQCQSINLSDLPSAVASSHISLFNVRVSICLTFHQLLSRLTSIYSMSKCQSDLSSVTYSLISHQIYSLSHFTSVYSMSECQSVWPSITCFLISHQSFQYQSVNLSNCPSTLVLLCIINLHCFCQFHF